MRVIGDGDINVSGTLVWYYYVCKREVWLMGHQIEPDQDNAYIELGRFIHNYSYARSEKRKELEFGHSKIDFLALKNGEVVVSEVKKSSRHKKSARMQLLFYLDELRMRGIEAKGELRFPQEKKVEQVIIDDEAIAELKLVRAEITKILQLETPPSPRRQNVCDKCGYHDLCWS